MEQKVDYIIKRGRPLSGRERKGVSLSTDVCRSMELEALKEGRTFSGQLDWVLKCYFNAK